jgi:putative radical SAM enzyme (TIGR03279 family)
MSSLVSPRSAAPAEGRGASATAAHVVAVAPGSPGDAAGVQVGDTLLAVDGRPVRDIIEYRVLTDEPEVSLELLRGGLELTVDVEKAPGTPLGIEIDSPVFDEVRTCDNHCEFCFIYQLPPGMRRSLHLKDDDYRLSFLYGNFTTLTRFTEADLERVVTEGLSPLYVSIHATDPVVRTEMLRNRRGAMSLRWLRALLDHGIEVHGQIVVCPGLNDGDVLDDTLCGVLDEYPELADVAVVPLGVSAHSTESRMRPHTVDEARRVVEIVERWQQVFLDTLGRRMVYAADEYHLLAQRPFPAAETYGDFSMHEDGIGMARAFQLEFDGHSDQGIGVQSGFFAWVDGAPAVGYRAPRTDASVPAAGGGCGVALGNAPDHGAPAADVTDVPGPTSTAVRLSPRSDAPVALLTGGYGARVLAPLVEGLGRSDVRIVEVENRFFGGNIAVAGLMVGEDLHRVLAEQPVGHRYLLPDVCLSQGRFLDGSRPEDLPRPVEIIATDGVSLRAALQRRGPSRTESA